MINFEHLIDKIKESLTLWKPPYTHSTEGFQKSYKCPNCGHEFRKETSKIKNNFFGKI